MHSVAGARAAPPAVAGPGRLGGKEQKDFEKMRQEVHVYGASQLVLPWLLPRLLSRLYSHREDYLTQRVWDSS